MKAYELIEVLQKDPQATVYVYSQRLNNGMFEILIKENIHYDTEDLHFFIGGDNQPSEPVTTP